ncbi:serine/threonine-protein kinase [Parvibacter caecicola]|uniref:non-specific serine/threonine protein kinase n=1 Tax=Parvibacter caecicola TaxID=747645 RepID=A0A4T9T749_9ACTN|nr:serine/threonine-protein kinase [Parvibacter caecicola]TJW10342.1 hypothetical protein E5982_07295 [Parvibacter caecicola]
MAKQKLLLDRYRVVKAVGAGGFATVYEALDTHLNRPVAIKVFELSESDAAGFHLAALDGKIAAELEGAEGASEAAARGESAGDGAATRGGAGGGADAAEPATAAFPSDPSFLRAREERLAARNGASLRKKPNFEELAQAFEEELEQEERAAQGDEAPLGAAATAAVTAGASGPTGDEAGAAPLSDAGKSGVIDLDNTVPWDEDEDLGPDEYFESAGESPTAEATGASGHGAHAAPAAGDGELGDELEGEPTLAFNGPASLPIIGAAAGQGAAVPAPHGAPAGNADNFASAADAPAANQPGSGTAVMAEAAASSSSANISAPAADAADDDEDDADEPLTSAFDSIPAIVEARLIASLNDTNIVTVYDCQESEGRAYIIMEFVDGLTLAQLLDKVGDQITLDMVAAIVAAVTGALETAHRHNVLHLDIKPENVLIDQQGQVKVTDFGLATLADASGHGHAAAGTIGYMPPEQLRSQPLDVRTDEWAVASLTYEMLTGTNQFIVDDLKDALPAIEDSELPVPSQMWDEAGDGLDDVVFAGLDIDPDDRYQTVEEFAQALLPQLGSARKGKKQLAKAVAAEEEPEEIEEEPVPQGPVIPLVDRVGPRGAQLLVRILSALCCGGCAAVAMVNFHALGLSSLGLAVDAPFVFWPLLVAAVALAAVRPTFGALAAPLFLAVSFFANGAFLLALGFGALTVLWWVKFCSQDEAMALCALLGPATGAIGMGAVAPMMAGALMSVGRAAVCAAYNALFALVMACLGSCTLLGWNAAANAVFSINMQSVFLNVVQRPETWLMAVAWVGAAALFSLFCARGTRFFDVLGSAAGAAVLLVAGWACAQLSTGFDPLSLAGCILPGAFAVVLALLGVPDRARRDIDDWEALRNLDDLA